MYMRPAGSYPISPVVHALQSVKSFLLFLYIWSVLFNNLDDATLSSLGHLHSMQIKVAITENLVFINISVTVHGIKIIFVSIPMYYGVKNQIKPFK